MTKQEETINVWTNTILKWLVSAVVSLVGIIQVHNYRELGNLADQVKAIDQKLNMLSGEMIYTKVKADRNEREIEKLTNETFKELLNRLKDK